MARKIFPSDTLAYGLQGNLFIGKPGMKVYIYTDILGTLLADIQDMANGALAGSYVTVDSSSQLPLFQGPNTGVDTLYAKPEGGAAVQIIYARVDDRLDAMESAWTAYVPVLGNGWAIGNGAIAGRYKQIGKTVSYEIDITFGNTSTFAAGQIFVSLPVPSIGFHYVVAYYFDNSAGFTYMGFGDANATDIRLRTNASPSVIATNAAPFAWAVSDVIRITGTYEAA
jgi:hypothetical protein